MCNHSAGVESEAHSGDEALEFGRRAGKIGDGKVFVYDLGSVVRIRTGELDADAL